MTHLRLALAGSACLLLIALFGGCKKNVAAVPPSPPAQAAVTAPTPMIALRAAPASIDRGQSTSLQWETQNATSVRIQPDVGSVGTQGTRPVSPASSVTYTATAVGPGGSASDTARITVRVPSPPAATAVARTDTRSDTAELFRQNVHAIYFDYDKSEVPPGEVATLIANAMWLKEHDGVKFRVEGNCDERGSAEYNLGLGDRRANRLKEFLIAEGVHPSRITTLSYGEEHPVCRETSESGYAKNRRADFVLVPLS